LEHVSASIEQAPCENNSSRDKASTIDANKEGLSSYRNLFQWHISRSIREEFATTAGDDTGTDSDFLMTEAGAEREQYAYLRSLKLPGGNRFGLVILAV
jgi:hypothetical protein